MSVYLEMCSWLAKIEAERSSFRGQWREFASSAPTVPHTIWSVDAYRAAFHAGAAAAVRIIAGFSDDPEVNELQTIELMDQLSELWNPDEPLKVAPKLRLVWNGDK